jgi:argininosuccinate lyase
MMPQKKNPDVAELIRGKTATVIGDATALLGLVKGLPLGYNRDLQEDKGPLYHAADSLLASLRILAAMVPELEIDAERAEGMISSFALATDLADHLVRKGVPFRQAHGIVAQLVGSCLSEGRELSDLSCRELETASPLLADLPELSPAASVRRKRTAGGTHPEEVAAQIAAAHDEIAARPAWLEEL